MHRRPSEYHHVINDGLSNFLFTFFKIFSSSIFVLFPLSHYVRSAENVAHTLQGKLQAGVRMQHWWWCANWALVKLCFMHVER